ncbi:TraR/DksA C4-type zinc finger protein [Zobellella maritima]|uniref:TraR/DksA C4-type zinc finger protein n=1 Tax=Zobellella maritima TaxID=2059725 RepID=UPI000E30998C|nr:TraR/DksA C4-type zinc finger protein [Zobellella maritima]
MPSKLLDALLLAMPLSLTLESWRQHLKTQLPYPVQGANTLFIGEPPLAIVDFQPNKAEVLLPAIEWRHHDIQTAKPRLQGVVEERNGSLEQLMALVDDTIAFRLKSFRECASCGKRFPPEMLGSLGGEPICRDCIKGRRVLF